MNELIKLSYFLQADVQHLLISETATFNFLEDQLMRHSQCYGRAEVATRRMWVISLALEYSTLGYDFQNGFCHLYAQFSDAQFILNTYRMVQHKVS